MQDFVNNVNSQDPITDQKAAIKSYCDELEASIYEMIKEITIVIPPGTIIVEGSAVTQTNAQPITIDAKLGAEIE